jgi:hypothetical protein
VATRHRGDALRSQARHLLRDRDAVYGRAFRQRTRRIGIDAIAPPDDITRLDLPSTSQASDLPCCDPRRRAARAQLTCAAAAISLAANSQRQCPVCGMNGCINAVSAWMV